MTERKGKADLIDVKELLGRDQDFVRAAAVATLIALEDEYRAWLERLPKSLVSDSNYIVRVC
jgi:hypothetical protein